MEKKTILYISGDGHSGSTLLDIVLGSMENAFSTGELNFFPQKGIKNREFCSCGKPVPECEIWSKIISEWEKKRVLDLDEYILTQKKLTSNKNIISSYKLLKNPSGKILDYLKDTKHLYDIIFEVTNSNYVIDSSKVPNKILILKNIGFDIKIIHLIRRFGDILNSGKRKIKKDLEAGIEHDMMPRRTYYVLLDWILKNLTTIIFSKDLSYIRIQYEEFVTNPLKHIPKILNTDLEFDNKLKERGPFYPEHLVAGNKIRMQDHLFIAEKPMNTSYSRLKRMDKILARCIDYFY